MAFRDNRTIAEIEQDIYEPYELELYERESLSEIKKSIENHHYVDKQIMKDHMEFLEHLLFKLQHIKNEEQIRGNLTKELDDDIYEIQQLINELSALYRSNA
jgi:hypothetical protein